MTYTLTLPDQSEREVKGLQEGLFAAVDILLREVSGDMRSQLNGLNPLDPLLKKCHYYDDQGEFFVNVTPDKDVSAVLYYEPKRKEESRIVITKVK
jgi:hypothetical protein